MSHSQSPLAHRDIAAALDRAIANGRGIRIHMGPVADPASAGAAINLRQRIYTFRKLDRAENRKVYAEGEPLCGRSVYDSLTVTPIQDLGQLYLMIEVSAPERFEARIEDLAPYPTAPQIERTAPLMIEHMAEEAMPQPTREEIEAAMDVVNEMGELDDLTYWTRVHDRLGLTYGELFPIMEKEGIS